jgi:hypothetical protein
LAVILSEAKNLVFGLQFPLGRLRRIAKSGEKGPGFGNPGPARKISRNLAQRILQNVIKRDYEKTYR